MSGVLVVLEPRPGSDPAALSRISLEALAGGLHLAQQLSLPCIAALAGSGSAVQLQSPGFAPLRAAQLEQIYAIEHPLLAHYTADGHTLALEQLIRKLCPEYVVFPHTYQVRDYAPALAVSLGQPLVSDVIAIRIEDGSPIFVRQLFQGRLNADYRVTHPGSAPIFLSIQAGAFRAESLENSNGPATAASIVSFIPQLTEAQIRTRPAAPFRESARTVDLASAPLIVSVGRGIGEQQNLALVESLAAALGAELAASRPICDLGWLPMERQVGSSGQTVAPRLYLAVGISGAIQHLVGMKGAKTVVAINRDPAAPIFEVADYAVVGDLFEVVPELIKAIHATKGE
ncbi:MAG TPA: electron transfer flavoprotein subunit alpha/FixB family protein [Acidobacteriaceae bacterium]|nr:electron transfer flavoprotein subunit alpha/FixB family protein [Acidobacteriaceae bacterium]